VHSSRAQQPPPVAALSTSSERSGHKSPLTAASASRPVVDSEADPPAPPLKKQRTPRLLAAPLRRTWLLRPRCPLFQRSAPSRPKPVCCMPSTGQSLWPRKPYPTLLRGFSARGRLSLRIQYCSVLRDPLAEAVHLTWPSFPLFCSDLSRKEDCSGKLPDTVTPLLETLVSFPDESSSTSDQSPAVDEKPSLSSPLSLDLSLGRASAVADTSFHVVPKFEDACCNLPWWCQPQASCNQALIHQPGTLSWSSGLHGLPGPSPRCSWPFFYRRTLLQQPRLLLLLLLHLRLPLHLRLLLPLLLSRLRSFPLSTSQGPNTQQVRAAAWRQVVSDQGKHGVP